jgi:hypothetical protein
VESQRSLRTSGYLLEIWAAPTPGRMALIHIWMVLGPHSMMGGKAGSLWRWCAIARTLSSGCSSPQTIVQLNEVVLLRGGRETTRCAEGKCEDVSSNGRESEWKDGEWKNGDFHIFSRSSLPRKIHRIGASFAGASSREHNQPNTSH